MSTIKSKQVGLGNQRQAGRQHACMHACRMRHNKIGFPHHLFPSSTAPSSCGHKNDNRHRMSEWVGLYHALRIILISTKYTVWVMDDKPSMTWWGGQTNERTNNGDNDNESTINTPRCLVQACRRMYAVFYFGDEFEIKEQKKDILFRLLYSILLYFAVFYCVLLHFTVLLHCTVFYIRNEF